MKKVFLIIAMIFLSSCSSDDDSAADVFIGEWKLIKADVFRNNGKETFYYHLRNITYNFKSNNILLVTGGQNIGYSNGEYGYVFEEDYISNSPSKGESKTLLVKINNTKYVYSYTNGLMTLGLSYIDGADLFFVRK